MSSRCSLVLLVFIVFVRFSAQAKAGEAAQIAQKVEKAFSAKDLLSIPEEESGVEPILQPVSLMKEIKRQVQSYAVEGNIDLDDSPLDWWKRNERRFPHISLLARHLFSIAGSSAELERMFSRSGQVVNAKRPRLHADTATEIMFCHENILRGVI